MLNLYITSANKKEGKTFLTAGLSATLKSLGYSTSVYKPIQTNCIENNGFVQSSDLTFIKTIDPFINTHFSYLFKLNSAAANGYMWYPLMEGRLSSVRSASDDRTRNITKSSKVSNLEKK